MSSAACTLEGESGPRRSDAIVAATSEASLVQDRLSCYMQVLQGMIFVWGESGALAAAEADAMPVPGLPDVEMSEIHPIRDRFGQSHQSFISQYFRELPYGWDVLAENLQDPCECPTCDLRNFSTSPYQSPLLALHHQM